MLVFDTRTIMVVTRKYPTPSDEKTCLTAWVERSSKQPWVGQGSNEQHWCSADRKKRTKREDSGREIQGT